MQVLLFRKLEVSNMLPDISLSGPRELDSGVIAGKGIINTIYICIYIFRYDIYFMNTMY